MKNKIKQNNENVKNFLTGMKKLNIKIILVTIGLLAINQVAFAATAVLSSLPGTATSTVGKAFNISVKIEPSDKKVDVVKGTINFDNLSCQNITVANSVLSMVTPTCATPNFVIGIKGGTLSSLDIFSVSVKGNVSGQAGVTFSGVKVIGAGTDVAFNAQGGTYNIIPVQTVSDNIAPVISLIGSNPMFVKVGENYVEQGAVATDNVDGDITSNIKIEGSVDTSVVRSYKITYSVTDKAGNTKMVERTVVVNPVRSTESETTGNTEVKTTLPDTGIQIPKGVGKLNTSFNDNENVFTIVSTSSNTTTTTVGNEGNGGLVATVSEGFANIPNKPVVVLVIIALAAIIDSILFGRFSKVTSKNFKD